MFKSKDNQPRIKDIKFGIDNSAIHKATDLNTTHLRFLYQKKHLKSDEGSPKNSQKHLERIRSKKRAIDMTDQNEKSRPKKEQNSPKLETISKNKHGLR